MEEKKELYALFVKRHQRVTRWLVSFALSLDRTTGMVSRAQSQVDRRFGTVGMRITARATKPEAVSFLR